VVVVRAATTTGGPILVVDDDPTVGELITLLVRSTGQSATLVSSGEAALAAAAERRPALVLLDVRLPGVSGYEVCRRLRESYGARLPIMFVSGSRVEPHDRVAGLLLGADDYVVKPFFPEELAARVRGLLARSGLEPTEHIQSTEMAPLTERERQVLQLLAEGLTQGGIAAALYISPKTVATHIQRILTKLGVHSRAEAVARAFHSGLASTPGAAA
jgi:DNA-binding NarL/FixJ family response regulator